MILGAWYFEKYRLALDARHRQVFPHPQAQALVSKAGFGFVNSELILEDPPNQVV